MTEIKLPKSRNQLWIAVDPDGELVRDSLRDRKADVIRYFDYSIFESATAHDWEELCKAGWTIQKVHLKKGWPE